MSDEELNGCMEAVPCEMWGEGAEGGPALTLAPKCRAFSGWSRGEPVVGEVGKGDLLKRKVSKDVPGAVMAMMTQKMMMIKPRNSLTLAW